MSLGFGFSRQALITQVAHNGGAVTLRRRFFKKIVSVSFAKLILSSLYYCFHAVENETIKQRIIMKNKKVITIAAMTVLALAGATWLGVTKADAANTNGNGSQNTLVERVASKFNLSKDDVQAVADEVHTERQQARRAEQDSKLDKTVTDGAITQAQKDALVAKRNELRAKSTQNREEMQKWMDDNGIDHTKIQSYMGGNGKGQGRGMGRVAK
jgi:flagellar biosynthesis GTPase FlhF